MSSFIVHDDLSVLNSLPNELLLEVISYLDSFQVRRFALTSATNTSLVRDKKKYIDRRMYKTIYRH